MSGQKAEELSTWRSKVENVETAWIPMSDGRRLAARLLLPRDLGQKVPAILEYIPYRRRDGTRVSDDEMHYWFAAHGYASVRLDIAGTGDSDGLVEDEYVQREQDDAIAAIAWLAEQPWCSGSVGMIGISWGGFNGLQVAARQPKALKAVISVCSTVDRYADDVHFMGGCLLLDTLDWGGFFFAGAALPPDPEIVGEDRWADMWAARIAGLDCPPLRWMEHQTRDAFWRQGSVCENYSQITIPVMNVSGWADGYTAAVFRSVENFPGAKGIAGPWGHCYPFSGVPGPAIGFLQEALRWWDRWLKGIETGVEQDPALRVFVQDCAPPAAHHATRAGRWVGLPSWPTDRIAERHYHLSRATLDPVPGSGEHLSVASSFATGVAGGEWCAYSLGDVAPELPLDQREDDAQSLVFDTGPLTAPVVIAGRTRLRLRLAVDKPQAQVAVRLSGVHPDGAVERITFGVLNLSHRNGHSNPLPMTPNRFDEVEVELNEIAQTVPAGFCLRVAVSTSYWPLIWPSPEAVRLTIDTSGSRLCLPVLENEKGLPEVAFAEAETAPHAPFTVLRAPTITRSMTTDIAANRVSFTVDRDDGLVRLDDIGTEIGLTKRKTQWINRRGQPQPAAEVVTTRLFRRGTWDARLETRVTMTSDLTHFHMAADLTAYRGDQLFAVRDWKQSVLRHGV